jgi:hypothetical protein
MSEVLVLEDRSQLISHDHVGCAFRESGSGNSGGFFGDWIDGTGVQAHGLEASGSSWISGVAISMRSFRRIRQQYLSW